LATRPGLVESPLDPEHDHTPDSASVARRTLRAAGHLVLRQGFVQGMNVGGGILLARALTPAEFGIFGVLTFLLGFLTAFGDFGLGAGLVRQSHAPTRGELRTVFTTQTLLLLFLATVVAVLARPIALFAHLPAEDATVLRLIALALPFASAQAISSVQLERTLSFGRLAAVESAQAFAYNAVVLTLVWNGAGPMAIAWAILARTSTGALVASLLRPWPFGLAIDRARLHELMRFGIPFQGIMAISLVKDSITPLVISTLFGAAAVGWVNWSQIVAAYPVFALGVFQRLYLPSFSRMLAHPEALGGFAEKIVRLANAIVAPLAVLTFVMIDPITRIVYGDKWVVAIPMFRLLWCANLIVPTSTPLLSLITASGRSRLAFAFALTWALMTWGIGWLSMRAYGVIGYGWTNVAVQLTGFAVIAAAKRIAPFRVLRPAALPWAYALPVGALAALWHHFRPVHTLPQLVLVLASALAIYVAAIGPRLRRDVATLAGDGAAS
jgi:PST family polysaccharide transporter